MSLSEQERQRLLRTRWVVWLTFVLSSLIIVISCVLFWATFPDYKITYVDEIMYFYLPLVLLFELFIWTIWWVWRIRHTLCQDNSGEDD